MRLLLLGLFASGLADPHARANKARQEQPPSFLVVLADDMGFDVGAFGHPYAITPNLDDLARGGLRLTQHHTPGTTCAPSRAGLMSGRFPLTFNGKANAFGDAPTVSALLRSHGHYHTAHFGKWHLEAPATAGSYGMEIVAGFTGTAVVGGQQKKLRRNFALERSCQQLLASRSSAKLLQASVLCNASTTPGSRSLRDSKVADAAIVWLHHIAGHEVPQRGCEWCTIETSKGASARMRRRPFFANVWMGAPHAPNTVGAALGLPPNAAEPEDAALRSTPFAQLSEPGGVDWQRFSPTMRAKLAHFSRGGAKGGVAAGELEQGLAVFLTVIWNLDFQVGRVRVFGPAPARPASASLATALERRSPHVCARRAAALCAGRPRAGKRDDRHVFERPRPRAAGAGAWQRGEG